MLISTAVMFQAQNREIKLVLEKLLSCKMTTSVTRLYFNFTTQQKTCKTKTKTKTDFWS